MMQHLLTQFSHLILVLLITVAISTSIAEESPTITTSIAEESSITISSTNIMSTAEESLTTDEQSTITSTSPPITVIITSSESPPTPSNTFLPPVSNNANTTLPAATSENSKTSTSENSKTSTSENSKTSTSENSKTSTSTSSTNPPTSAPSLDVKISETNVLLSENDTLFVKLEGPDNATLNGTWLVIHNAEQNMSVEHLLIQPLSGNFSSSGKFTVALKSLTTVVKEVESVLIALYGNEMSASKLDTDKETLKDVLLYSTNGQIEKGLEEAFLIVISPSLVISKDLIRSLKEPVSFSRVGASNADFILTSQQLSTENPLCTLNNTEPLQMKLSGPKSADLNSSFSNSIKVAIISEVNEKEKCGLTMPMFQDITVQKKYLNDGEEIQVNFTLQSFFPQQLKLAVEGYKKYVNNTPKLPFDGWTFLIANCSQQCFSQEPTHKVSEDDKIRTTIAVVVSCIGVFLLVVIFVILYIQRKKKGIVLFRMTRLDEDENDLVGDMDDFVGNQGPTFHSFR